MTKEEYEKLNKQYMIAQEALTQMKHLLDHYAGIKIDPFEVVEEIEKNEPDIKTTTTKPGIKITTTNCNYHLTRLYKERDDISAAIDMAFALRHTEIIPEMEEQYDEKRNEIERFLEFRRNHPNCALEGDPNYGPV